MQQHMHSSDEKTQDKLELNWLIKHRDHNAKMCCCSVEETKIWFLLRMCQSIEAMMWRMDFCKKLQQIVKSVFLKNLFKKLATIFQIWLWTKNNRMLQIAKQFCFYFLETWSRQYKLEKAIRFFKNRRLIELI